MPNHQDIYLNHAWQYERLIACQICLADALKSIIDYKDLDIIDLGAGTGRLASALADQAGSILLVDESAAMLKVAAHKLSADGYSNWRVQQGDHRIIPVAGQSADLVVSGWSLSYLVNSEIPEWQENLRQIMIEIQRVLRPGGSCVIIETLGTGVETPMIYDFLQAYFTELENEYAFKKQWIRTDYHFADQVEAEQLIRFFFGDEMADRAAQINQAYLPECAGVWWRSF